MNKHISTVAASLALVSAIGLAYAQTGDQTNQSQDPNAPAQVQQKDAQDAVNNGSTATPDWRSPDTSATATDNTAATSTNANTMSDSSTPAPAVDSSNSNPATTDNSAMSTSTATDSTTPAPAATDSSSTMITERAPQADRN